MSNRSSILPFLLSLGTAAALLWLFALGLGPDEVDAGYRPAATPPPAPRYVAVSGTDAGNDCTARSNPCRSVQHAVDLAWAGTVIRVAQGTYSDIHVREGITQVVHLDKRVTLQGGYTTADDFRGPPDPEAHPTILDAQGQGRVIVIDGAGPTIEGFTITGGAGYYSGGGVRIDGGFGTTLRHNRIISNSAEGDGGGFFVNHGSAEIVGNQIVGNESHWSAGLRIINDSDVAVVGNEIRGNVAQVSAGGVDVACCGGTTPLIARNLIVGNDGGWVAGGIGVRSTNARIVNNVLARNEANWGTGIRLNASARYPLSVTLAHNTLVGQGVGDEGVRAEAYAAVTLVNNIVASYTVGITNTAPASATVIADHTLFHGNGTDHGPGVSSTNALTGSPAFVSPATGDYHIRPTSAALGAGVDAGVRVDIDGDPRPRVPDVGADEYWAPGTLKRLYLPVVMHGPGH